MIVSTGTWSLGSGSPESVNGLQSSRKQDAIDRSDHASLCSDETPQMTSFFLPFVRENLQLNVKTNVITRARSGYTVIGNGCLLVGWLNRSFVRSL